MTGDEKGSDCLGSMPRGSRRNVDQRLCAATSYPTDDFYHIHGPVILHSTCMWVGLFDMAAPLSRVLAECLVPWAAVTIAHARLLETTEMHSGGQKSQIEVPAGPCSL